MAEESKKNWKDIISSIKGPLSFLALVVLCFQVIILAIIYRIDSEHLNLLALLSSLAVLLPVSAVSLVVVRSNGERKEEPSDNDQIINIRKIRVFITSPMSTHATEDDYQTTRKNIMEIIDGLRKSDNIDDVFYFNEQFPTLEEFEHADLSVPEYLNQIDQCDYFVLIAEQRQFSSIHFESGYAMGKGKKSIYFVKNNDCLPFLTKLAVFAYPHTVRTYEFSSYGEISKMLSNKEAYL